MYLISINVKVLPSFPSSCEKTSKGQIRSSQKQKVPRKVQIFNSRCQVFDSSILNAIFFSIREMAKKFVLPQFLGSRPLKIDRFQKYLLIEGPGAKKQRPHVRCDLTKKKVYLQIMNIIFFRHRLVNGFQKKQFKIALYYLLDTIMFI